MRCDPLTTVSGNPKSQIRNPKQIQKPKPEARFARRKKKKEDQKRIRLGFGIWNFEFGISDDRSQRSSVISKTKTRLSCSAVT